MMRGDEAAAGVAEGIQAEKRLCGKANRATWAVREELSDGQCGICHPGAGCGIGGCGVGCQRPHSSDRAVASREQESSNGSKGARSTKSSVGKGGPPA